VPVDRARLTATFSRLAAVDSPSLGEGAFARVLADELARMGWSVQNDATGPDTGNVIARCPGDPGLEPLLFTSHMDVVAPCRGVRPQVRDGWICSSGGTVLGADAKASVAALLEASRQLQALPRTPPLELVFTWGEELCHQGAKALDLGRLRARRAFVLDGLVPVGTIVTAAPEYRSFSVRVVGRAAHAGVEPERGTSAIAVAARALAQLTWGRIDADTTTNVGTISGGSNRNAVPAEVHLTGEVRSHAPGVTAQVAERIKLTFEKAGADTGASVLVDQHREYAGYALASDSPVVRIAERAYNTLGGQASRVRSGGGSDANELNARSLPACVLGIGAEGCHTVDERIALQELVRLTDWVVAIIACAATS
jgi:tripeptide aminopeptidase